MMANFQNRLNSRITGFFFTRFFAHNNSKSTVEKIFDMFFEILIFDLN